jgi:lipid-binding SYLF domain-containing protein
MSVATCENSGRHGARLTFAAVLAAALFGCSTLSPEGAEQKRQEIDAMSDSVITRLVERRPKLQQALDDSPGYAVADMAVTKVPMVGGGGGSGVIIDKRSGARTYVEVTRFEVGGGMGLQSFKVLVLFEDEELLDQAMKGFWHMDAGAEVGAREESAEGSVSPGSKGYQVFKLAEGGAVATVTVRAVRARPFLN